MKQLTENKNVDNLLKHLDVPIESDKWKNLLFDKRGKSYLGEMTHPTKKAAFIRHTEIMNNKTYTHITNLNGERVAKTFVSHNIQIPWKE